MSTAARVVEPKYFMEGKLRRNWLLTKEVMNIKAYSVNQVSLSGEYFHVCVDKNKHPRFKKTS